MINRYAYKDATWIDLYNPGAHEIKQVMEEFGINPDAANELSSPSTRSRIDLYKDFLYVILHFPVFRHSHAGNIRQEVDFIIGGNFVITTRYDVIDAIDKFTKMIEVGSILDRENETSASTTIFFGMLNEMYKAISDELAFTEDWIAKVEEQIFMGKEKEMVISLSEISRVLLQFKKTTDYHREVLDTLVTYGKSMFGEQFSILARSAFQEYFKVEHLTADNLNSVSELRETNNSLLSTKQNEIMKVLTIMAFVTFPLSLLAAIFGMNTDLPFVGHPNDFWIVMSIMGGATILMFIFFKYKKWL
jgi:magnesium transporter